jgi:hypothetical protein
MTPDGTDLSIKHTHVNDCFINTAEIQCKKLNIINVPDSGSPFSQKTSHSKTEN